VAGSIIALLAGCQITWDGKSVGGVNTLRLKSLLTYLLLPFYTTILRQQPAFPFWSESSESQALVVLLASHRLLV